MATCTLCKNASKFIAGVLGVCSKCIRENPDVAKSIAIQAHWQSRIDYKLPTQPYHGSDGILCNTCVNECRISGGNLGYCGLRKNQDGKLIGISTFEGKLSWYHDPLPTNCVADWVCPAGTGAGYPNYAYKSGPEYDYKNLAVFFHACSFNCLFCQNWHFKDETLKQKTTNVENFILSVDEYTSCVCYFGGDPAPQLPFAIKASKLILEKNKGRILRICWETNGSMNEKLLRQMMNLSLESGGCIKFDLKAWDENLHVALTGITNQRTLENFSVAAEMLKQRTTPPPLVASTLLIPGYIDEIEVRKIARFIVSLSPEIPYSLLAFYPHFYMNDLPLTSKSLAQICFDAAKEEGVKNVKIGNIHLLA